MRTPSDSSSSQRLGTGHVESPVANRTTSWPAAASPWASLSTTSSIPPYRCGGTGAHGGATKPMRIRELHQRDALPSQLALSGSDLGRPANFGRVVVALWIAA